MSYDVIGWKNGKTPIDEINLNHMDSGIKNAHNLSEENSKKIEQIANEQIPEEYVKKSVDDYINNNQSGIASKENLEEVKFDLSTEIETREKIKYGNTPFYIMDYPLTETYKRYFEDGTERTLERCSKIRPCPKHIGFNLKGNSRMFIYIGDMVDGQFVPDENYFIIKTSAGAYNYFNPANNRILTVEEGKYFYYSIDVDDGYELIYGDSFPDTKLHADGYTPYYTTYGTGKLYYSKDYYSLFIPNGCYYMLLTENKPSNYERNNILLSTTVDVTVEESDRYYNTIGTPSFGYIDKDLGSTLLRLPDGCNPEDIQLYLAPDNVHSTCSVGIQERAVNIAGTMINNFKFKSQKAILWSDSRRSMDVDKKFFGIPYSSRWINSHHVGFEVSPETALNALNDEYSIAYDGGVKSNVNDVIERFPSVSGHTEIGSRGGAGYGLVCSTFVCLMNGCAYPQSNRGFSFDGNFALRPTNYVVAGMSLMNKQVNHCAFIDEMFDSGYTVYEGVQPCCAKSVHTGNGQYAVNYERTRETFLDDYVYEVSITDRSGHETNFTNFNVEIANGSIRPWRGNKCVYGDWDKSEKGSGIGITIHDGANTAYLVKPNGITISFNVNGLNYLDITDEVTASGTYELYSDVSSVREYFRYYSHDEVTISFDEDGKAVFSHDDVLYVYADVTGYGMDFENVDKNDYGPVVIAKGKKYKAIAENPERIVELHACIVEDPNKEKWGKYSALCKMA